MVQSAEQSVFRKGATQYLAKMPDITRVAIVTDAMMVKLGYVEKVEHYLRQRQMPVAIEVFSDVEPDPSTTTVDRGTEMMRRFQPDCIIALGGGSPMDAAKAMWLFYEYPDTDFNDLKQNSWISVNGSINIHALDQKQNS